MSGYKNANIFNHAVCGWLWSTSPRLCSSIWLKGIHSNAQIINLIQCAVPYMTMFDDKLFLMVCFQRLHMRRCWGHSREGLTLDNVGDHQRGTAVVAGQTSTGQILFDLEGKQIPGRKHKQNSHHVYIKKKQGHMFWWWWWWVPELELHQMNQQHVQLNFWSNTM